MGVALTTDPREFHGLVWPYLEARPERNVLATILLTALDGRYDDVRALYGYWTDESGAVAGVALRTPPFPMVASELDRAGCSEAAPPASGMLFTDLANPTSNKIYAEVGYRRFGDWEEEHSFAPPDVPS
jgi:hypothetical protein